MRFGTWSSAFAATLIAVLALPISLAAQSNQAQQHPENAALHVPGESDSHSGIPFEVDRHFGSILIHAQVNGQPATLVVDTGSSHTILSSELLQVRPLALEHADAPAKGSGYIGTAGWGKATVEVGTLRCRIGRF